MKDSHDKWKDYTDVVIKYLKYGFLCCCFIINKCIYYKRVII